MRPYQTTRICFATRQELQQAGDTAFEMDRFPKRSVLPFFRCKFHWSPSNERSNVPSLTFHSVSPPVLHWEVGTAQDFPAVLVSISPGEYSRLGGRQRKSPQHLPQGRAAHGASSLLPRTWLNFLSLIKFHWNKENWMHRGMKQLAPTNSVLGISWVSFLPRGILGEKEEFTICLGVQPEVFWYNPDVPPASQNCHQHYLQTTIQIMQPQRHKRRSPAGMQSTRGISVMSPHSTSGEIQDRVVRSLFSWWIFLLEVDLLLLFTTGTDMM